MAGHIRQRRRKGGGRTWQARYPDPLRGGTNKIERTFRTKREASDWLTEQQAAVLTGTHVSPRQSDRPFGDVIDAWKESWPGRLSPTTERRYQSILDTYLIAEFRHRKIGSVTHEVVQRYVNRLASDPKRSAGTVRNVYAVLRTAMTKGVRMGLMRANPCTDIDLPRPSRKEMLVLTPDEVRALAEAIDPHYRAWIYTAALTGLRSGELAGLQRQDVDLLHNVMHVRRALKDVNGSLELGPTKTHAQRTISLPAFLRQVLEDHLAKPSPVASGPETFVFTMKNGQPLRHNLVYNRYFKRAVAGDPKRRVPGALPAAKHALRFHDLRHTCASLSIAAGAHPKLISARLGHSTISLTLDRYGHLYGSMEQALGEALNAAFEAQNEVTEPATIARQ